jgi:hypothetical protein
MKIGQITVQTKVQNYTCDADSLTSPRNRFRFVISAAFSRNLTTYRQQLSASDK